MRSKFIKKILYETPDHIKEKVRLYADALIKKNIDNKELKNNMEQTAVNNLIEKLLPFIDRSKISDTMLQNIVEEHLLLEKKQIYNALEFGWKSLSHELEEYYINTFENNKLL